MFSSTVEAHSTAVAPDSPSWRLLETLLLVALATSASAAPLRIHGSNTIGERLMPALLEAWLNTQGYVEIVQQPVALDESRLTARGPSGNLEIDLHAHGSSTGFAGLIEASADLAMSSRPISAAERESLGEVQERVVALDGLAVIVPPSQRLQRIDLALLRRVFSGDIDDWAALGGSPGRIALHARDERSGTFDTFRSVVLADRSLSGSAQRNESTAELAAAVAANPLAIGFVGLAGVQGVRALAIADGSSSARAKRARGGSRGLPARATPFFVFTPAPRCALELTPCVRDVRCRTADRGRGRLRFAARADLHARVRRRQPAGVPSAG